MAISIVRKADRFTPPWTSIVSHERMSPAFEKFHLSDGRALHHFKRGEPFADPHDHPFEFVTSILSGGYVEEVFHITPDGWRSEMVERAPGSTHHIPAEHIHRIVSLPEGSCWTLVSAGPHVRTTRFYRFGEDVRARDWNRRKWMRVEGCDA